MNNKDKSKKNIIIYTACYGIMFILYFILHMGVRGLTSDDVFFSEVLKEESLLSFIAFRYMSWSSRVPIEALLVLLASAPIMVWRILDICMITLAAIGLNIILKISDNKYIPLLALPVIMMVPTEIMYSAGFMATTINYIWPAACGLYAASYLFRSIRGCKVPVWEYFLIYPCLLFALFSEQISVVFFVATLVYVIPDIIDSLKSKHKPKLNIHWYIFFALSLIAIIYTLTCPGNANRMAVEADLRFIGWETVTFPEKLAMGFMQSVNFPILGVETNFIFFFLAFALLYINITTKKKWYYVLASAVPFIISGICLCPKVLSMLHIDMSIPVVDFLANNYLPSMSYTTTLHFVTELIVYILIVGCTTFGIIGALSDHKPISEFKPSILVSPKMVGALLFAAALCSRIMTGFGPTVYVSHYRTAILECIILAVLNGYLLIYYNQKDLGPKTKVFHNIINITAIILGLVTVIKPLF